MTMDLGHRCHCAVVENIPKFMSVIAILFANGGWEEGRKNFLI